MAAQLHQQDLVSTSRDLLTALDRSNAALNMIARTLENEFEERFGHTGTNPLEIAKRLRKLQQELPALKQECQTLLSCKQELIDSARRLLDANSSQLSHLCSTAGFTPQDDEGVHDAYDKTIREWEGQVLAKHAGAMMEAAVGQYSVQNLNMALARARLE